MDFFARVKFHHRIVSTTLTRRNQKNDRDKKKGKELEKNNNIFFECLSRKNCAISLFTSHHHRRVMLHFEHLQFRLHIFLLFHYPFELQLA